MPFRTINTKHGLVKIIGLGDTRLRFDMIVTKGCAILLFIENVVALKWL